jgi:hypothetical protein
LTGESLSVLDFISLYIGDYFSDTLQFNAEQHAVLQKLLLRLWIEDPRLLKDRWLRRSANLSRSDWRAIRGPLLPLLEIALCGIARWTDRIRAYDGQRLPAAEWRIVRNIVLLRDDCICAYCGSGDDLQVDHRIPISKGGSNRLDNLVTACSPCNQSKGPKSLESWLRL